MKEGWERVEIQEIRLILAPIDGSDCSLRAAELAMDFAKLFEAKVAAIFVIDAVLLKEMMKVSERQAVERELEEKAERYLKHVTNMAEKRGLRAEAIITRGEPFEEIIHYAESLGADLISIGTHGRRGARRVLLGSVAERVIEYAPCPVIVVR